MLMHQDKFVTKWVSAIKLQMAGMCEDGFVIPMIALFYNDAATNDILESKRKMRLEVATIEQRSQLLAQVPWYYIGARISGRLASWKEHVALRIQVWRHQPTKEAIERCLGCPEFDFLKYLHKLTERMAAWRAFPDKHLPPDQLPKEFVDVKGQLDAPQAVYEHLDRIQEAVDAFIPAEMQRTLCALMLSKMMKQPDEQLQPSHKE
jgi:hypothetical protein